MYGCLLYCLLLYLQVFSKVLTIHVQMFTILFVIILAGVYNSR